MTTNAIIEAGNIVTFELERAPVEPFRPGFTGVSAIFLLAYALIVVASVMLELTTPLFLGAPVLGAVIALVSWLHARPEKVLPPLALKLGVDGLLLGDQRVGWSEFQKCEVADGQVRIVSRSKEATVDVRAVVETTEPGARASLSLGALAERIDGEHQRYLARPVARALPTERVDKQGSLQENYRGSNRGLLVRVATHPAADLEDRKAAVRALASDPNARAQIEAELDHTLDEETVEVLRAALDVARR